MDQKKKEEIAGKMGYDVSSSTVVLLPNENATFKMNVYAARVDELVVILYEYDDDSEVKVIS